MIVFCVIWLVRRLGVRSTAVGIAVLSATTLLVVTGGVAAFVGQTISRQFLFYGSLGEHVHDVGLQTGQFLGKLVQDPAELLLLLVMAAVAVLLLVLIRAKGVRLFAATSAFVVVKFITLPVPLSSVAAIILYVTSLVLIAAAGILGASVCIGRGTEPGGTERLALTGLAILRWVIALGLVVVVAWASFGLRLPFDCRVRLTGFTVLRLEDIPGDAADVELPAPVMVAERVKSMNVTIPPGKVPAEVVLVAKRVDLSRVTEPGASSFSQVVERATELTRWPLPTGTLEILTSQLILARTGEGGGLRIKPQSQLLAIAVEEPEAGQKGRPEPLLNVFFETREEWSVTLSQPQTAGLILREMPMALGRVVGFMDGGLKMEPLGETKVEGPELAVVDRGTRTVLPTKTNPLLIQLAGADQMTVTGHLGELAIPDGRLSYERLFPVGQLRPFRRALVQAKGGFIRMGFDEPINLHAGDMVELIADDQMGGMRMESGEVTLEGSCAALRINQRSFGNKVWDKIGSGTQQTIIGLLSGMVIASLPKLLRWWKRLKRRRWTATTVRWWKSFR